MIDNGFVFVYRSLMDKGYYQKSDYVHLWVHLLFRANHKTRRILLNNQEIEVKRGQFVTSRQKLADETGINSSKVERILKCFKIEQQIEQQSFSAFRLITVIKYDEFQNPEQHFRQRVNSKRTASEQPVNTNNTLKNENNERKEEYIRAWNAFASKHGLSVVKSVSSGTKRDKAIRARINDPAFILDDVFSMIEKQPFLTGDSEKGWTINFDWILSPTNYPKILEGQYIRARQQSKASQVGATPSSTLPMWKFHGLSSENEWDVAMKLYHERKRDAPSLMVLEFIKSWKEERREV